jgi:hypothetical protein
LRVPSYLQALQVVARADLVAFVPKRLAESLARPLSLVVLKPPMDPGKYREYLFHSRRTARDPASIWLRKLTLEIGEHLDEVDSHSRLPRPLVATDKKASISVVPGSKIRQDQPSSPE